jgi:hypothetical protein
MKKLLIAMAFLGLTTSVGSQLEAAVPAAKRAAVMASIKQIYAGLAVTQDMNGRNLGDFPTTFDVNGLWGQEILMYLNIPADQLIPIITNSMGVLRSLQGFMCTSPLDNTRTYVVKSLSLKNLAAQVAALGVIYANQQ